MLAKKHAYSKKNSRTGKVSSFGGVGQCGVLFSMVSRVVV